MARYKILFYFSRYKYLDIYEKYFVIPNLIIKITYLFSDFHSFD